MPRFQAIDALRGLIMILMAIDHSSAFIARQHASEFWAGAMSAYDSAFPFLTRWITHLCAPGFFFLMGAGIYWSSLRRPETAVRRTLTRGLILFLLAMVLETPVMYLQGQLKPPAVQLARVTAPPPLDGSPMVWGFITLAGLGLVMMVCGLLLRLPRWAWVAAVAASVFATNTLLPASGQPGPWWFTILLAPGISQGLLVVYPVVPWLGPAAAGLLFAAWWREQPERASQRVWLVGLALVALAVVLRASGGWGNIRPPRDTGWIEFLNNVKYPPSLVFWSMAMGIDLLLLAGLLRWPDRWLAPLVVFGQTPLFFYLTHFYVFAALALVFFREPASLEGAWLMWAVVLGLMYPACAAYRRFKLAKPPDSLWRMF